jgi:hypothetical protein
MMETKDNEPIETIGAACQRLAEVYDGQQPVVDTQKEMTKGYVNSLIDCARRGEQALGKEKPFYVCVQLRKERHLANVIRTQFYYRQTRPSPSYDLSLYWYDPKAEDLRFVWCIPDIETTHMMAHPAFIPEKNEEELSYFCRCFLKGTLI